ncbi:MAG: hypothetical protein ABI383_14080 [Acidobacteriaceae bacterium]
MRLHPLLLTRKLWIAALLAGLEIFFLAPRSLAQQLSPSLYQGMRWRQIGPFRAGRVSAVSGIPGDPATYYMGTPGGGLWKTTDGGMIWNPIFDQENVASIGSVAAAPSDRNILYVGTGDVSNVGGSVNQGEGMYKSTDAGKTWQHIGLEDSRHIGALWVDPKDPNIVFAAALGHTFAPNPERGLFKTTDGGKSWRKVLYKDDVTGAIDVTFAADDPKIGFATLWGHYIKADNPRAMIDNLNGAGIYKTTDAGETWTEVKASGLPTEKLGRIGVAVAPDGKRVFAIIAAPKQAGGLFRSDDGGTTWQRSTTDERIQGSGYFGKVFLDPRNPDILYLAQTSMYRSTDGARTFVSYKGAPGGDDNHVLWIDPANSARMILGSDQGATISLDEGKTWTSWYNQPTGQIYHLSVDNRFPYWVYGTQQDSGSVATLSRGDYGAITMLDWDPIAGYEFGYILPDPLNPNMISAGGEGRGLVRIDRTNRQVVTISPNVSRDGDYRTAVNPPLAFSPQDPHLLAEGTQFLLATNDAGMHWKKISPDLTARPGSEAQDEQLKEQNANAAAKEGANAGAPQVAGAPATPPKPKTKEEEETTKPPNRSAINTFSPSPIAAGEVWVGTTNGLIQLTKDNGATWKNVSPPNLSQWTQVSIVEASHFDAATAYAAIDGHAINDFRPHFLRTQDGGSSWQEISADIPDRSFARVIREDPARKGLLYAGTETAAYVSFDDGDHWSLLQQNIPTTSIRDLVVHGDDLVAATYGRAFWILDDLTPLRQIKPEIAHARTFFFQPQKAMRLALDLNGDTPFPPDLPAGENPPHGAILDYFLNSAPSGDITLAIYDGAGKLVRQISSQAEPAATEPPPNVPDYWLGHPTPLTKHAGMNRFVWDLRYPAPQVIRHEYPISALYGNTQPEPQGVLVVPGSYEARLTVDGKTYQQPLEVALDPRVNVAAADLHQQFELATNINQLATVSDSDYAAANDVLTAVKQREQEVGSRNPTAPALAALADFEKKAVKLEGQVTGGGGGFGGKPKPTFVLVNRELGSLSTMVESADAAPTDATQTAYTDYCSDLGKVVVSWNALMAGDLTTLNDALRTAKLAEIPAKQLPAPTGCQ